MKSTNTKFVGFWHYGVILTYMSVASAIVGIGLSVSGYPFYGGIICLWISGLCDAFDGTIAQTRRNRSQEDKMFGARIDSLSDLIAFGVAPVMIGYGMGMHEWYYIVISCVFVLCALVRLAYFDVTEELRLQDADAGRREYYEGLPVTNVAIGLPVFYLAAIMFRGLDGLAGRLVPELVMAFCYLLISFLFVFRFKVKKFRPKALVVVIAIVVLVSVALILVNALVFGCLQ